MKYDEKGQALKLTCLRRLNVFVLGSEIREESVELSTSKSSLFESILFREAAS